MPFMLSVLGGAGIAWILIESGYAIHAFLLMCVWIVLLWTAPVLSMYFLALCFVLALLTVLITFWEFTVAMILGVVMFFLIVGGLIHAAKADEFMAQECYQVEECE